MSHKLYFSLIPMSFETEGFFKTGLPPSASSTESKNRLKPPPRTNILFSKSSSVCRNLLFFSVWIIQINQNENTVINHSL